MSLKSFESQWNLDSAAISRILRTALENGGDLSELFFEKSEATHVTWESHKVDRILEGSEQGIGLRVIVDGRYLYAYTTRASEEALLDLARTIAATVKVSAPSQAPGSKKPIRFQESTGKPSVVGVDSLRGWGLKQKIELVRRIESGAMAECPDAAQISTVVRDSYRESWVFNSDGMFAFAQKPSIQLVAIVVAARDGRMETGQNVEAAAMGASFLETAIPEEIGRKAAARAKILLTALPAPAGILPVVLSSDAGGTMIHEAVGHGLEADLACPGLSVYNGKLGQKVASDCVTVVDDGTVQGLRGSFDFDDEGHASQKNTLIENGVLKSYLVDRISAMKYDLMPTGNGRRESFRHRPMVRMTNTYIAPGSSEPEAILKETSRGIFVKAMGGGEVNTASGDFVFSVTEGYLIRDGKLAEPIRGATLVGNGPKVLHLIDRVGTDLNYKPGTCGKDGQAAPVTSAQPTLRIRELTVGGEVPAEQYFS